MAVLTKITSRSLADNAVTSAHVQADVIAAGDIAAGAITASELADDAVGTDQLSNAVVVNTSGNITTTGSGALSIAGVSTLTGAVGAGALTSTGAISGTTITGNPKATNASTVAATYANEQETVHGTTFTTTGSTVTGDVVFESLTDEAVTLSGTGTITGSGGKIVMKGLETAKTESLELNTPHINAGGVSAGDLSWNTITKGTLNDNVTYPDGHIVQVKRWFSGAAYNDGYLRNHKHKPLAGGAFKVVITPKYSGSSMMIIARWTGFIAAHHDCVMGINKNNLALNNSTAGGQPGMTNVNSPYHANSTGNLMGVDINTVDVAGTIAGVPIKYTMWAKHEGGPHEIRTNVMTGASTDETGSSEMIVMEIAGIVT